MFPCDQNDKQPKVSSREEGKGGVKLATTDRATIERWWQTWPDAMIAVRTGSKASGGAGFFVVDLDPGDEQTIEELQEKLETWLADRVVVDVTGDVKTMAAGIERSIGYRFPSGPRVWTPRGGLHLWFLAPDDVQIRNRANILRLTAPGVDARGDDGYVILPPSIRRGPKAIADGCEGVAYTFDPRHHGELDLPRAPAEVVDLVLNKHDQEQREKREPSTMGGQSPLTGDTARDRTIRKYALDALDREIANVRSAPKGNRNATLNNAALSLGKLIPHGFLAEGQVRELLEDAAADCGLIKDDGLKAARDTIESGLKAGKNQPRDLHEVGTLAGRGGGRPPPIGENEYPQSPFYSNPATPKGRGQPDDGDRSAEASEGGDGGGDDGPPGDDPPPPDDGDRDDDDGDELADFTDSDREILARCFELAQNDIGNAWRLMHWHGEDFLNVEIADSPDSHMGLHVWTGTNWDNVLGGRAVQRFAQDISELIKAEATLFLPTKRQSELIADGRRAVIKRRETTEAGGQVDAETQAVINAAMEILRSIGQRKGARRKFGLSSGNISRQRAMISLALPHCSRQPSNMDSEKRAINVLNGTLRLHPTGVVGDPWEIQLHEHARGDLITKVMPVMYDPQADCPAFKAFIERFQPDPDVRAFLQLWHGLGLTGLTEQAFVLNYGTGANGKTTFIETIARLMGDYAQTIPAEALTGDSQRRGDQATPELARLAGARLVRAAELPRGQNFREGLIKMLTGGDPIPVRHLHGRFWDLYPVFKAVGTCNERPDISGVDEGIWRRVKLVMWDVTIPIDQRRRIEDVLDEFDRERSGILNWLLAGLARYMRDGFVVPEKIREATESYRADMDPVGSFLESCVYLEAVGKRVTALAMFQAYTAYCHANNVRVFTQKNFGVICSQKGLKRTRAHVTEYIDCELHDVPPDPERRHQGGGWRGPATSSVVYAEQPFNDAPPPDGPIGEPQ